MTHICAGNLTIFGSDHGLLPGWRQAIIWASALILLIELLWTTFSEILIVIYTFLLKKIHFKNFVWKMAAILSRPQYVESLRLNDAYVRQID